MIDKKGISVSLLSIALLASAASSRGAASLTIANPGFEDSDVGGLGGIGNGIAASWTLDNGLAGTWNIGNAPGAFFNAGAPEGNQILFVGFGGPANASQILADTLQPNTTYTLSFFLGQRLDLALSTYSVSLQANGQILASDVAGSTTAGDFISRTVVFNSGANPDASILNQPLGIFVSASGVPAPGGFGQAEFDAFSLDASPTGGSGVPEPSTFLLLGSGIMVALSRGYFQKQKS